MRIANIAISTVAGLLMAAPAFAVTVEAGVSKEFQTKLQRDLGVRESKVLTDSLTRKVTKVFERKGVKAERIVVTIEDAKPNRPTWAQTSSRPGLDAMRSVSIGGARMTGTAYDASGKEIGKFDYQWYEPSIENVIGYNTWADAYRSFDRFADRFADQLT